MYRVSYDGFTYETDDPVFAETIPRGESEPYPRDLVIVKQYLRAYPTRCRTYVDVGAHIGTTIAPYSRLFESTIGFEANPKTLEFLHANLRENNIQCRVEKVGLYDHNCRADILLHGSNSGCYCIQENDTGSIECRTLDSYDLQDVDFIKLDIEGAELAALKGAEQTLRRCKPLIQFESNGMSEQLYGVSYAETLEYLERLGYRIYADAGTNLFFYVPRMEPYRIVCYWGKNPMTENRIASLKEMGKTTECEIVLLTLDTLQDYLVPAHPLHPAFQFLSDVHQSDYVRTYMMHHHGGGYSDVKRQTGSWKASFDALANSDAYIMGYPEIGPSGVAYPPVQDKWDFLIGNGAYIVKPGTPLTHEWYTSMISLLSFKLDALQAHPASHPRDRAEDGSGYPIEWNEMLGRIFHRVSYAHRDHILRSLPAIVMQNYM